MNPLLERIDEILARDGASDASLGAILGHALDHFACQVGTIHEMDAAAGCLRLRAHRGLPEVLMDRVRTIPIGKGMAGLAALRREPVQVCNLQTDASGVAQPNARKTAMEGSVAVPMLVGGAVRGTLGIAKSTPHDFTDDENTLLLAIATRIGSRFR